MKDAPTLGFLLIGGLCAFCTFTVPAADVSASDISNSNTNTISVADMQRVFGVLQEQLQAMQLAMEHGQQATQADLRHTAEEMAARFQVLDTSLKSQRADELDAMQKTNHFTLRMAGIFVAVMFLTLMVTAYFQWRVASRLATLVSVPPTLLTLANGRALSESGQIAPTNAVEQANQRLLSVVQQLQRRILELEHLAHAPQKEEARPAAVQPVER